VFLRLGLLVLGIRVLFFTVLGSPIPGTHVLVTLPQLPLPDWAKGVQLGGAVSAEGLLFAFYGALRLAVLLACVGAANALANPARLLRSLPGALYEAGVAVVVALTFAPNLVADVQRLRAARRLRGRSERGVRALLTVGVPVLEDALERSVNLAAAMDARGFGRQAQVPRQVRLTTAALTLAGLLGCCVAAYGLLGADGAGWALPLLALGALAAAAGLVLGGRRAVRTRYRPDPWGPRAWLVAGSGLAVAAGMLLAGAGYANALNPPPVPLAAPGFPLLPAAFVLLGLLPAVVAPAPARPASPGPQEARK
jgi:energy-coupling factor transport system permease protein